MKPATPIVVTTETLEQCLDRIAQIVDRYGRDGIAYLPYFDYLEKALDDFKARDDATTALLDKVRQRLKQPQDRKAA